MAATPKTGAVFFRGLSSGRLYTKALYNADVVNTYCRLDNGAGTPGATGGENYAVFGEDVALIDCSFVTGIVDTANLALMLDYSPTGFLVNWATSVNTLPTRPNFNIKISKGRRISFMQVA